MLQIGVLLFVILTLTFKPLMILKQMVLQIIPLACLVLQIPP